MEKLIVLFLIVSGCTTSNKPGNANENNISDKVSVSSKNEFIVYNYKMISPAEDSNMHFRDGYIDAQFSINYHQLSFTIKNISRDGLQIFWDDASIDIFEQAHKIIHNGIKFGDSLKVLPPTTILPGSSIDDFAIPADNIYFTEGYGSDPGSWDAHDLLISNVTLPRDSMLLTTLKQQQLSLHLPVATTSDKKLNYIFTFKVNIARIE